MSRIKLAAIKLSEAAWWTKRAILTEAIAMRGFISAALSLRADGGRTLTESLLGAESGRSTRTGGRRWKINR